MNRQFQRKAQRPYFRNQSYKYRLSMCISIGRKHGLKQTFAITSILQYLKFFFLLKFCSRLDLREKNTNILFIYRFANKNQKTQECWIVLSKRLDVVHIMVRLKASMDFWTKFDNYQIQFLPIVLIDLQANSVFKCIRFDVTLDCGQYNVWRRQNDKFSKSDVTLFCSKSQQITTKAVCVK